MAFNQFPSSPLSPEDAALQAKGPPVAGSTFVPSHIQRANEHMGGSQYVKGYWTDPHVTGNLNIGQMLPVILAATGLGTIASGALAGIDAASLFGTSSAGGAGTAGLGEAGTTAAMQGGFGAGTAAGTAGDVAVGGAMPTASTLAGNIAPMGATPLSQIAPTGLSTAAPAAGAGLTSGAGTTGLTAATSPAMAAGAPLAATGASGLSVPAAGGGVVDASGVTGAAANAAGTAGAASIASNPGLLQQLQSATGLSGTQLASLLQGGIGALNSSNISNAIGQGVNAQAAANAQSQSTLKDIYNTNLGFQKPYQEAGTNAVNALNSNLPYLQHQFDASDLQKGLAPNYDFMLQQGQMANQRAANVGGGALSGNTLQGLQNYTQNYAGNAYQNAFNNFQNQRNNIYSNLSNLAGIGQTANAGAVSSGNAYGTGTVNLNTGLAAVQAAGALGQAQAGAQGATGLGNSVLLSTLLNQANPITPPQP